MKDKITKLVNKPNSGVRMDPATSLLTTTIRIGSLELTALGAGVCDNEEDLLRALSRPCLRKAVEDAFMQLYRDRPLRVNVFRSTDVLLQVKCVLHNAMH